MENIAKRLQRDGQTIPTVISATALSNGHSPQAAPVCPLCRGAGYVRRDLPVSDPDFGKAVACKCIQSKLQQKRQDDLYQMSNLGRLNRMTFENFQTYNYESLRQARDLCVRYARQPEGWIILRGSYGTGKTHLAVAIANYRIKGGDLPLFVVVPDLLDHLRATYAPSSVIGYDERFNQIRNSPLLILDDLGTQAATPWAQEKLFQIFNHRYNAQLPTIVTTNQSFEDLDVRIRSRLVDPNSSQLINISAPDHRQSEGQYSDNDLSSLPMLAAKNFGSFRNRQQEVNQSEYERLDKAHKRAHTFASNPTGWFLITGDSSTGKTHLAAAIANHYRMTSNQLVMFVVVPDLLDHLRAAFSPQSAISYDKRFEQIKSVPLLVLDDLGTQSATPWAKEKLFQLFNYRYIAQLPTVITMNEPEQIEQRLVERMSEMSRTGNGARIEMNVPAYGRGVLNISNIDKVRNSRPRSTYGGK